MEELFYDKALEKHQFEYYKQLLQILLDGHGEKISRFPWFQRVYHPKDSVCFLFLENFVPSTLHQIRLDIDCVHFRSFLSVFEQISIPPAVPGHLGGNLPRRNTHLHLQTPQTSFRILPLSFQIRLQPQRILHRESNVLQEVLIELKIFPISFIRLLYLRSVTNVARFYHFIGGMVMFCDRATIKANGQEHRGQIARRRSC